MATSTDTRSAVCPVSVRHSSLATIAASATTTTGQSQGKNEHQDESEEMLMMFSTSPDSLAGGNSLRHSRLVPHSEGKTATTTELAAFSRDPYAISISQLVSDNDDDEHHRQHSSDYRLNTRYDHLAPSRRVPMRPFFIAR